MLAATKIAKHVKLTKREGTHFCISFISFDTIIPPNAEDI